MSKTLRKNILPSRSYTPVWKDFEGYCVYFLKSNYWRVQSHMEYEDCVQEAHLLFLKLKKHYGNLDTKKHFMGLFGTAMTNRFNDLANKVSKLRCEVGDETAYEEAQHSERSDWCGANALVDANELVGDFNNDGMLAIMIEQAPSEIKLVLSLFMKAPVEVLDMFSDSWKQRGKKNDFGNAHLCEVLGLPEKTDIVGKVRQYFTGKAV